MPKSGGNARKDYTVYDKDGSEKENRTDSSGHGYSLDPGCRIVLTLTNASETLDFYFPMEMLDSVFAATQG